MSTPSSPSRVARILIRFRQEGVTGGGLIVSVIVGTVFSETDIVLIGTVEPDSVGQWYIRRKLRQERAKGENKLHETGSP